MSIAMRELYAMAQDLRKHGAMSTRDFRQIEALRSEVPTYAPDKIKALRASTKFSQTAFASLLNVSLSTVQKWEAGVKKPDGASRKLLHLLETKGVSCLL